MLTTSPNPGTGKNGSPAGSILPDRVIIEKGTLMITKIRPLRRMRYTTVVADLPIPFLPTCAAMKLAWPHGVQEDTPPPTVPPPLSAAEEAELSAQWEAEMQRQEREYRQEQQVRERLSWDAPWMNFDEDEDD